LIGLEKPFLHLLVSAVVETLGDYYPELVEKEAFIKTVIKGEEERFNLTLDKGLQKFNEIRNLTKGDTISGKDVFLLYDTYGFPPDLTAILAEESSLKIDEEGFEVEMEKQRSLAREHSNFKMDEVDEDWVYLAELKETQFVGYEADRAEVKILAYTHSDEGKIKLILDKTPFYAESGGQVADKGKLFNKESEIKVTDVKKENDRTVHYVEIQKGELNQDSYTAIIESEYRKDLERNHTATHLLHSVLRELLGEHVQQKGSLVAAGYLRFDFTHFQALTEREKDILETLINKKIRGCSSVEVGLSTIEEAKKDGAIALFGEKYDDTVRTIKIGGYSYELCGGTHLSNTGEIGSFKIISESAIASGVRRIEAITGPYVEEFNKKNEKELSFIAKQLGVPENQITDKIARMIEENRMLNKQIEGYEQQSANKELDDILGRIIDINGVQLAIGKINAKDNNALRAYGDNLRDRLQNGIGVLGSVIDGKASLLVVVSKNLTKHIKAGELISKLAVIVNGRGGGRPDMAMAGGKDYSKIKDAFEEAKVLVQQTLENYKVE
jgi:alanyl-tRNA synthetase